MRNTSIRLADDNGLTKKLEPAIPLKNNFDHVFNSVILSKAPHNYKVRRNLEASYSMLLTSTWNEQKDFDILTLFKNGVTWIPTSISC